MSEIFTPRNVNYDKAAKHNYLVHDGAIEADNGERYYLTNRTWQEVNTSLGELPGRAIAHKLGSAPDVETVTVVDIGAGSRGVAVSELRQQFAGFTPNLQAVGIDLTHHYGPEVQHTFIGSATHLPFRTASVDVAYSNQSVSLAADWTDNEKRASLQPAFNEAIRILKPGGIFIIDFDLPYDRPFAKQQQLERINLPKGVTAYWEHQGARGRPPVGNFILSAIIKNDPIHGIDELVQALALQPERRIEP